MEHDVFLKKYTTHLNENQLKAVQTVDGPVLLLAVPGSGKTTVLVTRLGYMIYCSDIAPQILRILRRNRIPGFQISIAHTFFRILS